MSLKGYLQDSLNSSLRSLELAKSRVESALDAFEELNLEDALCTVELKSLRENTGEHNASIIYKGTLTGAIIEAEEKFKRVNARPDVQANYFVSISLGQEQCIVPEEFYKKIKE